MIFHRIGKIAVGSQLVAGHIACGSCKQARYPVYDGGTGMLYGGRFYYMELGVGLAAYRSCDMVCISAQGGGRA